jgi:glycosyltransferase involved in cell wall biosynthesis
MKISFIIPARNEDATIAQLAHQINHVIAGMDGVVFHEIIFVDDGSTDRTWHEIEKASLDPDGHVRGIRLRRNCGKAAALSAGFNECIGDIVFTMDADLQDDPGEIPAFVEKLNEGFDLVSGWKRIRNDPFMKTAPSRLFNFVTARMTGIALHDFNCGFKCYRREVIDNVVLYGELHRYMPVLAHDLGFRIGELAVKHHPRTHGSSKYGWERYTRGMLDLLTVLATTRWLHKPGHLFGGVGILLAFLALGVLAYLGVIWALGMGPIGGRPLLIFGVLAAVVSIQMISLGVIAEFLIKFNQPKSLKPYISARAGQPQASGNAASPSPPTGKDRMSSKSSNALT